MGDADEKDVAGLDPPGRVVRQGRAEVGRNELPRGGLGRSGEGPGVRDAGRPGDRKEGDARGRYVLLLRRRVRGEVQGGAEKVRALVPLREEQQEMRVR